MKQKRTFQVDRKQSDEEYHFVHVRGLGTVSIKAQPNGIVVDIYPYRDIEGENVASTWAGIGDLEIDESPSHVA